MCVQACVLCVGAHVHSLCVCSVSCVYRCVCVHVCGVLCVYYMRVCGGGVPQLQSRVTSGVALRTPCVHGTKFIFLFSWQRRPDLAQTQSFPFHPLPVP